LQLVYQGEYGGSVVGACAEVAGAPDVTEEPELNEVDLSQNWGS
jgi:hypothetical protein